jgi:2-polyprenyl-3-methyl-5-hydroxy-6-metoxy-1,4-benzoquinol methylase
MQDRKVTSLTDTEYWDRTWAHRVIPDPLDPVQKGLNGVLSRSLHQFFASIFRSIDVSPGDLLLEAGCGGSVFLPYFSKHFGFVAEGLDNSQEGVQLSEAIAAKSGIAAPIFLGDVLHPPEHLVNRYKIVFSMGLAEHFRPTTAVLSALTAFLQPSGHLITFVPNMHGAVGLLQRLIDPAVFSMHVPLSPESLAAAHRACGLQITTARHLMTACFSVLNFSGPSSRIPERIGLRAASWTSKVFWVCESLGVPSMPNRITSPYVVVVAHKAQQ